MGRVLAVDWGERRLGLALSDPTRTIAQGLGSVEVRRSAEAVRRVAQAAQEWDVDLLLVGLPLRMDGTEGEAARRALAFADSLKQRTGRRVVTWDERLTSVQAERALKERGQRRRPAANRRARRQGEVDVGAAILLLQSYLDREAQSGSRSG